MRCVMCNKEMDKVAHWVGGYPIGPKCYLRKFGASLKIAHEVVKVNQPSLFGENMSELKNTLKVKRLHENAVIPKYQTAGAACFDLSACFETLDSYAYVNQNTATVFRTGLSFEVPDGYVMLVYSRSGHGFKQNVRLSNCVGVIDSDYRGEIMVKLIRDESDGGDMVVRQGDRIAQALLIPVDQWAIEEVSELSETERGANGIGSTGVSSRFLETL